MPPSASTYQRIADALRREINDGDLAAGEQMPTLAEITDRFGVSSATASRATELLLREGLIISRPGAGSFVRPRPDVVRMMRSTYGPVGQGSPWLAEMRAAGRDPGYEAHSSPGAATPVVAARLRIEPGAEVMRTDYVYMLDGEPSWLATSWEPMALTLGTPILLPEAGRYAGAGVRDRMAAIGHAPTHAEEAVAPRTLTEDEGARLGLHAGIAVLAVERTYYEGELPLETADLVLPPHYRAVYQIPVG